MISHAALARLSKAAYSGAPTVAFGDDGGAFFTVYPDEFVVTIPGTHNFLGWRDDFNARPKSFPTIGFCHDGFGADATALWGVIKGRLPGDRMVTFNGHSLGGAISQILAAYHVALGAGPCRVVTCGAPRVAFFLNRSLAPLLKDTMESPAYERRGDIVPKVPTWFFVHPVDGIPVGTAVETIDPAVNHSIDRYAADLDALGV